MTTGNSSISIRGVFLILMICFLTLILKLLRTKLNLMKCEKMGYENLIESKCYFPDFYKSGLGRRNEFNELKEANL